MSSAVRTGGMAPGRLVLAASLALMFAQAASAIHPMDQLHYGQDLVDRATLQIDGRIERLRAHAGDRDALFQGLRELSRWEDGFASDTIAVRYFLEGPEALLIRDGIADTLTTRVHEVLGRYVAENPTEILDRSRQIFEVATAEVPIPPGRFLGFHFVDLARILGAQADTILAVIAEQGNPAGPAGAQEGYLRRLWDLAELHRQMHSTAGEKYLSRIVEEDWILQRLRSRKCGERCFHYLSQQTGMKEDPSERCMAILYGELRDSAALAQRIECQHWGHIFKVVCDACADTLRYSVPLPFYRQMQLNKALGKEELPDLSPYFRPRDSEDKSTQQE
ncbi:MAG: hypothetical protein V1774_11050 [Candidatus Eisenbacteria bacterium]